MLNHCFRLFQGVNWSLALPLFVFFFLFVQITIWLAKERKIRRLGGHASQVPAKLPLGADLIWKAIQYAKRDENLEFWDSMFKFAKWGSNTVEANTGGRRVLFTADPENIKAILATQFHDFGKGRQFNHDWHEFLGDSIFSTDAEKWQQSRSLIRPQFVKDRVADLATFEHHTAILLQKLDNNGQEVDVKDLFFRYTLDAATDFLLGRSVQSLDQGSTEFAHAFAEIQRVQNSISRAGPLNWMVPRKAFRKHLKTLNHFVEPYIEETLALSQEELEKRNKSDEGYTFLHALASYTRDRTVLRDQLVAVLLAGRDTTACTLSWLLYELSLQPDIVKELRNEVEQVVGWNRTPSYADLKSMKYLQNTLNETLRLYPVVPFNVRVSLKDTTIPRGGGSDGLSPVATPAGTPVVYSTHYMQLTEAIYPPTSPTFSDPLTFDPSRWNNWQPKAWTYIPFNGGPRICVGQQFALTEMGYTLVRILQKFSRVESRMPPRAPGLYHYNEDHGSHGRFADQAGEKGNYDLRGAGQTMVWKAAASRQLKYKSEIVLQPAERVAVAFYKA